MLAYSWYIFIFLILQEDKEKKRLDQLERKKELAKLAEDEMDGLKSAKPKTAEKLTRAQIQATQERQRLEAQAGKVACTCLPLIWLNLRKRVADYNMNLCTPHSVWYLEGVLYLSIICMTCIYGRLSSLPKIKTEYFGHRIRTG